MKVDIYIRVSQVKGREGDSFQSPIEQERACRAALKTKGWEVGEVNTTDLDRSGGTAERPGFQHVLSRIENKEVGGIAVIRADRFARSVVVGAECLERIQRAGGKFFSATEQVDYTSAAGKFQMNMLLTVAQYQRDMATEGWATTAKNAIGRGVHFRAPFGYRKAEEWIDSQGKTHGRGPLVIHAAEAVLVRRAFGLRAGGATPLAIAEALNEMGVCPPRAAVWSPSSVVQMLESRTYLGEAHHGKNVKVGAHESIVDEELWSSAHSARKVSRTRSISDPGLLTGIIRCAGCRHALRANRGGRGRLTYRCGKHFGAGTCPTPATIVRDHLEEWVVARVLDAYSPLVHLTDKDDRPELRATVTKARREFESYRDDVSIREALGDGLWRPGLVERAETLKEAEGALRAVEVQTFSKNVRGLWVDWGFEERRAYLRQTVGAVFVRRAAAGASVAERARIFWPGEEPDELPVRGQRAVLLAPLDWVDRADVKLRVARA